MRKSFTKHSKSIVVFLIAIISVVLLSTAVAMLANYSNEVAERAVSEAQRRTIVLQNNVQQSLAECTAKAISISAMLADCENTHDAYGVINNVLQKSDYREIVHVRYFIDNELYDENGNLYPHTDIARDFRNETPTASGYIGSFNDVNGVNGEGKMSVIGFYAPVNDSKLIDAVVIYYTRNKVEGFFQANAQNDAEFSVLVVANEKNEIVVGYKQLDNSNIKDELRLRVGEAAPVEKVIKLVQAGESGTVAVKIEGRDYVVSVGAEKQKMQDLAIVELYNVDLLCASSLDFINTVIMIIILFAIIAAFVISYLAVRRVQREKEFFNMETMDTKLQCSNRAGFEKKVKNVLERNVTSNFFVVVAQLRHYKHILENFGDVETSMLLMHLRSVCSKTISLQEVYGHAEEGDFLILMHAKNRDALVERLKILTYTAAQYKGAHKFDILLRFGIYEIDRTESLTVSQMIDFANEANNSISQATAQNANMQFNFYNNELRKIRLLNEDMELRMEGALRDGEFQLFYQPKYNLRTKRQDGCEALVRWYDPKTQKFNPPALFMQLFETNGFIVKLDKYVYAKVCEYISYTIAHGGTVYPVSVNVSRITAVQPDFVEYYYKTKRKYGISDGLIMIEFTESFAYENYEILRNIVDDLHDKGFKCSIDDFGCGYSSYRILKSLPMDEIKLDKFFLEKSGDEKRDTAIFQSIIQLAKNLGMKVTQEGVETKEDLLSLLDLGCDVIQGYYYSHPLPLSDYINFVATSREHNIT